MDRADQAPPSRAALSGLVVGPRLQVEQFRVAAGLGHQLVMAADFRHSPWSSTTIVSARRTVDMLDEHEAGDQQTADLPQQLDELRNAVRRSRAQAVTMPTQTMQ